jgi:putative membrane protein
LSERAFLLPDAKSRTTEVIRAIEAKTSAEVVVTVRPAAERHLATSAIFGGAVAALTLLVILVSPRVYDIRTMPFDALLAFVLAALVCHFVPALKRLLTPKTRRFGAAQRGASAAFVELGIGKTKQRTGVLVFVSLFERTAVVVADEGVPTALLGEAYEARVREVARSAGALDVDAFLAALTELGTLLASVLPRRPDDVNELTDEVA